MRETIVAHLLSDRTVRDVLLTSHLLFLTRPWPVYHYLHFMAKELREGNYLVLMMVI